MREHTAPMKLLCLLACLLFGGQAGFAKEIVVNWKNSTISCPARVGFENKLPVTVLDVNDLLYQYTLEVRVAASPADLGAELLNAIALRSTERAGLIAKGPVETAADLIKSLKTAIEADVNLSPKPKDGKYPSIGLAETQQAWIKIENLEDYQELRKLVPKVETAPASDLRTEVLAAWSKFQAFGDRVHSPQHKLTAYVALEPGASNKVTVDVRERFNSQPTSREEKPLECTIASDVFTLSVGIAISTIAAREYTVVHVPKTGPDGQTLSETYDALAVQGATNRRPVGTALFNFAVPLRELNQDSWGLAVSTGPAVRLGGVGTSSSFGWFGGVSLHLWRYVYLMPGFHFGEFADFPVGFSQNSAVPPNFGTPVPVKRWTAKFGFSMTFLTKSFASLKTQEAKPDASESKTPGPKPAETSTKPQAKPG